MRGPLDPMSTQDYHPMILPSNSVEVGRQQHIDNLLNSRYNYSDDWVDRERVEEIKKEIKP